MTPQDEDVTVSSVGGLTVLEEDDGFEFDAYEDGDFGDLVGDEVDKQKIREGKTKELRQMDHFGLYEAVPKEQAVGKIFVKGRWVVTPKGEAWRCRWVGKEFRALDPGREGLFTPASSPDTERVIDVIALVEKDFLMTADAPNAYWQVPETGEVYTEAPPELLAEREEQGLSTDIVLKLLKKHYGERDASVEFGNFVAGHVTSFGFARCAAVPCFFVHKERKIKLEIHQDDFHVAAKLPHLLWLQEQMKGKMELKWSAAFQAGDSYSHLKCFRKKEKDGTWILGNPKYINDILDALRLEQAVGVPTPITSTRIPEDLEGQKLDDEHVQIFRRCVGIARFLRKYRGDLNYTVKELSHALRDPREADWQRLKRLGRYLKETRHFGLWLPGRCSREDLETLTAWSDSDWANDKITRKSVSSGMLEWAGCNLVDYSKSQSVVGRSSGESEWYAAVSAAATGILVKGVLEFLTQRELNFRIKVDSSTAKAIGQRQGVGRLKHLALHSLWLQDLVKQKVLKLEKTPTDENKSDLGTKVFAAPKFRSLRALNGYCEAKAAMEL